MVARTYIPGGPLGTFIESFYYYSGYTPDHSIDRFLPDGNIQLVIDLTDTPKYIYDNTSHATVQTCNKAWFSGFRTKPITIPSGRDSEMLIITFRKGKASYFLREPLHTLTNVVVAAELVLNINILHLRDALRNCEFIEDKFRHAEEVFLTSTHIEDPSTACVDYLVDRIVESPTAFRMKAGLGEIGFSHKHLIALFKRQVGIPPKEFLRVMRFQKAITRIEENRKIDWSSVAIDGGFYDQSHFIAEFKAFSGFTPGQYIGYRGTTVNHVPVH